MQKRQIREDRPTRLGRSSEGYALVAVLLIILMITGVVVTAQFTGRMELRIGGTHYLSTQAGYAAEAGAEKLLASIREQMGDGLLTPQKVAAAAVSPPKIPGYTFAAYSADLEPSVVVRQIAQGPFAGLTSLDQDLVATSSVEGPTAARAAVEVAARAQAIPIFQFAVFYEDDLEIFPGPRMDLRGRVHTNSDLYVDGGAGLYLWEMVTAAGDLHLERKSSTLGSDGKSNYLRRNEASWVELLKDSHDFGGDDNPLTFPTPAQDKAFDDYSKANWDHKLQTRASGIVPLELPIPEGIDPYELIQPCTGGEPANLAAIKYACKASLLIRVRGTTLEVLDGYGNPEALDDSDDAVVFIPNAFYDDREQSSNSGDAVSGTNSNSNRDVIEIDISEIEASEYGSGIFYVTADPAGLAPKHESQYVVRVRNGQVLEAPLTIATNLPLYVLGDYNSLDSEWQPASFASDALTILSGNWDDSKSGEGATENLPIDTKVQAALLSGHSPTPFFGSPDPGGQLENFPRFLEDWSANTVTIFGSFISLWFAQVTNSPWSCCQYYVPPRRDWNFDQRFLDPSQLPPGTPAVGQIVRVGYVRRY